MAYDETAFKAAETDTHKVLKVLNTVLEPRTYLVGESITLADICLASALMLVYTTVLDKNACRDYVNLNRWFLTVVNHPNFKAVVGETLLLEKAMKYAPTKAASVSKPAAPKGGEEDEDMDSELPEKPKEKNPLDLLPPTTFNLEDWKRFYSNNDARPTSIDYFWKNFDPAGYSIWRIDYKYNDELQKIFMSSNLIGGLFQRMERLRKYCFGSVLVFGEDGKNEISGYLVFRGQEIPPEMKDVADFESYYFKRVDINSQENRDLFNDYLAWDGALEGKKFADGKIFK